ncbi:MAG: hypothetical protein IT559_00795 [Alphaproteobacteria bacterium]|nr:hypothetical protein [Alphaproteobacteria bacterium]
MCCDLPVQTGVKQAADCKCYGAVMKAYTTLAQAGRPLSVALEAAKIVYTYHHPEDSQFNAALTVERWVQQDRVH